MILASVAAPPLAEDGRWLMTPSTARADSRQVRGAGFLDGSWPRPRAPFSTLRRAICQCISYGSGDLLWIARVCPRPVLDLRVVAGVAHRTLQAIERRFQHGDLLFGQSHRASHVARNGNDWTTYERPGAHPLGCTPGRNTPHAWADRAGASPRRVGCARRGWSPKPPPTSTGASFFGSGSPFTPLLRRGNTACRGDEIPEAGGDR